MSREEQQNKNYIEKAKKNTTPKIVFPIINSLIAIFLLVSIIILKVKNEIETSFFIFGVFVSILYPLTSWYNSYFSKRKMNSKIYDFEKETENLIKFSTRLKGYKIIDATDLKIKYEYVDNIPTTELKYNYDTCLINDGYLTGTLLSIGVSFMGLLISPKNNKVINIGGMLPRSIWFKKTLKEPTSKIGEIYITDTKIENYLIIKELKDANTYYDEKTGWVCIGNKKQKIDDVNIKFMENAILVINENKIKALWLNVGHKLEN